MTSSQIWAVLGLLFLTAELVSISFVFAFLSVGALVTALLTGLGLTSDVSGQLLCFSVVTIITLVAGRKPLRRWFESRTKKQEYTEYVGDRAKVILTIPAHGEGRIFYRGTEWIAVSETEESILAGKQVVIKRMDGIRAVVNLVSIESVL
ncbi:membrane protein implicated in regulation of membrane protease activity [Larkinella arboricola]|uniref:Membrane protein implicated in regulation of membrane protease activity n=1 Tax=Larkinella arboricola TaxID=643671 RepID=A0A327WU22_LARAB|nr:NfeD family protein [Larkinella arboricola]RAJ96023.1 membrane protein implicated in regulation of membrane protease activity [Larkinella arboricola]